MTREDFLKKWGGKFPSDTPDVPIEYRLDIPKAWYPLVDRLFTAIFAYLVQRPSVGPVMILQVKEKFNKLRVYYDGGDDTIRGFVIMAELVSQIIEPKN
jgi:hypothetical protein